MNHTKVWNITQKLNTKSNHWTSEGITNMTYPKIPWQTPRQCIGFVAASRFCSRRSSPHQTASRGPICTSPIFRNRFPGILPKDFSTCYSNKQINQERKKERPWIHRAQDQLRSKTTTEKRLACTHGSPVESPPVNRLSPAELRPAKFIKISHRYTWIVLLVKKQEIITKYMFFLLCR